MEPKLTKDFYLLSLNPKNGFYINYGNEFAIGILGAILMDLYAANRIAFQDKRLIAINSQLTNYSYFDRVLDLLSRKGSLRVSSLLGRMSIRGGRYKKELVATLLNSQLILKHRKRFLGIPYNRYSPAKKDERMSIVRRMRDILLRNQTPENTEFLLLLLIHTGRLYKALSDNRQERKRMRQNMKEMLKNGQRYSDDFEQIYLLQQGLRKAISAANTAATAGAS